MRLLAIALGLYEAALFARAALEDNDALLAPLDCEHPDVHMRAAYWAALCRRCESSFRLQLGDPTPVKPAQSVVTGSGCVADSQLGKFAVQRRSPDPQAPCDFGHSPAVVTDRQTDDIRLDRIQCT